MRVACVLAVSLLIIKSYDAEVLQLNNDNINDVLSKYEIVLVNFYADWCRFSNMLTPIFEEASNVMAESYPLDSNRVALARVDCDRETEIAQRYKISKYPTIKTFRYSEVMKKEYRGQRSAEAFKKFVEDQLIDPISIKETHDDMETISDDRRNMLAYIESADSKTYKNLLRASSQLRSDCSWYAVIGENALNYRKNGEDVIYFRQPQRQGSDIPFTGLTNTESLTEWARELCVPRVRVLTFENAEELTEEGVPFLVLFHHPDDHETPEIYKEQINLQLGNDRESVTALTADGVQFAHPLHHLGKSANDLPLIAIDSFKHMYVFPYDVKTRLREDGLIKTFVDDLSSGKLHREYHYGPDPVTQPQVQNNQNANDANAPPEQRAPVGRAEADTKPPESVFKKLAPSHNRYTVLRDEL